MKSVFVRLMALAFLIVQGAAAAQAPDVTVLGPEQDDIIVRGHIEPQVTGKPEITHLGMAAPDVVVLMIQAQSVERGKQIPYELQPGDAVSMDTRHRVLTHNGERIGTLITDDMDIMFTKDQLLGEPLDTEAADQAESYRIAAGGGEGASPQAVFRKTKPLNMTRFPGPDSHAREHTIFLKLSEPLEAGKEYTIRFSDGLLAAKEESFVFDPAELRSEAVHINQVGYRPDDPAKLGFLSCWMGTGGGLDYPGGLAFDVINDKTGNVVFSGTATLGKAASDETNKSRTDVHELDFTAVSTPGTYRLSVEGVGCSFPFEIAEDVWEKAFVKAMRGFYGQRSGIEIGAPYFEDYYRPRSFHTEDGWKVYVAEPGYEGPDTVPMPLPELDYTPGQAKFTRWVNDMTPQILPNAWGGYMDAGDWDRRSDYVFLPLFLFDLAEMFPEKFENIEFNIPESGNGIPDLVDEAMWEIDFLRRMQMSDGSIFGAIESGEYPRRGEVSWMDSLPTMAYDRTPYVAFGYAANTGRVAHWFNTHGNPERAQEYLESGLKAFAWAMENFDPEDEERQEARPLWQRRSSRDARCLAAAELYRATGEEKWNEMFLELTRFKDPEAVYLGGRLGHNTDPQGVSAWTYLQTGLPGVDKQVQQNIRNALLRDAERDLRQTEETEFHWSGGNDREISWGALSMPESHNLVRAHYITGDERFLSGIVKSTLSGAGANPLNMSYVTRIGSRWPLHPLHVDSLVTNQPLYEGVTLGGPNYSGNTENPHSVETLLHPPVGQWPATEAYYDVVIWAPMNEYTVHQTMAHTSFVWGYLAARGE